MEDFAEFEIWQGGIPVASTSGPRERAWADACHYAMMYGQDGPCEIIETNPEWTEEDFANAKPLSQVHPGVTLTRATDTHPKGQDPEEGLGS
jgi:hypothetical protein